MNVATSDIPDNAPVTRRGTSDAASEYRPTTPVRNPISAGVTATETSTTATGHRRRTTSTAPASSPNSTPTGTGTPAVPEKRAPSAAHSRADTTPSPTSSTTL